MVDRSKVTLDVDEFSRKVWLKDVRVSPSDGNTLMGGVIPLNGRPKIILEKIFLIG